MTKYMRNHELYIINKLNSKDNLSLIRDYHLRQITWLQHERLIHLCVLALTTVVFFSCVIILLFTSIFAIHLLAGILGIMELFYVIHYFKLENTVQRWYKIANQMDLLQTGVATNMYDER